MGLLCSGRYCTGYSERRYGGLCGKCFSALPAEQRAVIQGKPPFPQTIINPPQSRAVTFLVGWFGGACGYVAVEVLRQLTHWGR